jgi:GTPase SAR1 family protein
MAYYFSTGTGLKNHNESIPPSFQDVSCGASGTGKSSLVMRLLLEKELLNYDKLYVFSKSLYQPEYQILVNGFKYGLTKSNMLKILRSGELIKTPEYWNRHINPEDPDADVPTIELVSAALAETQKHPSKMTAEFHDSPDSIPDPADLDRSIKNIMLFDDIMTENQKSPEKYFTRGRSANCDSIYISQNYSQLKLSTIRSNSNFLVFFKSSPYVVEHLYRTYYSADEDNINNFKSICKKAWSRKFGFLIIDLTRDFESGNRYRTQLEITEKAFK